MKALRLRFGLNQVLGNDLTSQRGKPLNLCGLREEREAILSSAQKVDGNKRGVDQIMLHCRQIDEHYVAVFRPSPHMSSHTPKPLPVKKHQHDAHH